MKYRVPAISELRQIAESGGLLSYGPNAFNATRRLTYFVDRILKGAKPADLPVEQATRLERRGRCIFGDSGEWVSGRA